VGLLARLISYAVSAILLVVQGSVVAFLVVALFALNVAIGVLRWALRIQSSKKSTDALGDASSDKS